MSATRATADRSAHVGVLTAACVSALVVNANTSAVTILLPAISEDLKAPISQLQWAVTGYMLVGAAVIVTSGALGDVFGRRRVFLGGLLLFVASCVLVALSRQGGGVIIGRMIQGAAGATILACGMSLLSVAASGAAQMKAITLWGAASAAGAALGPVVGGVLVDTTGWQGLFWIDAAIAAACIPLTVLTVSESRDPDRPRSIDFFGTILIAVILAPAVLALSEGSQWGWTSAATIGCFILSAAGVVGFVLVEQRVAAPLVDLQLLANRALVGATIAILIVAGVLNGLMYVLSLYFQDPDAFGMSAFEAGLATLPAAGALIAITPLITPIAVKIGTRAAIGIGFAAAAVGLVILAFAQASWAYAVLVPPLIVIAAGLGLSNGPASSASTAVVPAKEVGQASGISNMARYVGGAVAVAAVGAVYSSVIGKPQGRR
jgi:EmrB/QacA subfamily drug resistance transporter